MDDSIRTAKTQRAQSTLRLGGVFAIVAVCSCLLTLYGCANGTMGPTPIEQLTKAPIESAASTTPTAWVPPTALAGTPIPGAQATLTAAPQLRMQELVITNSQGQKVNMTVEIAGTEPDRELGLMFRASMPPDAGMLFDFGTDTTGGFWMANTILPLSIAFIKADGTILDIQDMQPLDETSINAPAPYRYAIEANQGFYTAHNIAPGDKVTLPGAQGAVIPGMPGCR